MLRNVRAAFLALTLVLALAWASGLTSDPTSALADGPTTTATRTPTPTRTATVVVRAAADTPSPTSTSTATATSTATSTPTATATSTATQTKTPRPTSTPPALPTIVFPGLALAATATPAPTQTAVQGDPLPPAAPVEQHAALPRSGSGGLLQSRTALFSGPLAVVLAMIALGFGCVLLGKRESAKNRQPRR